MREELRGYFMRPVSNKPTEGADEKVTWRLSCFDSGVGYARYIEEHHFPIRGKRVLDVGCAWGGHAVAFADLGAQVIGLDIRDYDFPLLSKFSKINSLNLWSLRANCQQLPFRDLSFDIIIALELVEHIESVEAFAEEVGRTLRPGGICLISTPSRLRSLVQGEPHYGMKGLTILPLFWQQFVARGLVGRSYPYPIRRQYVTASRVTQPFVSHGLKGVPVLRGRLGCRFKNSPLILMMAREVFWSFVVVTKPVL